ncbi:MULTISPECIES: hypothetical protein [unclassified Mesorhizobium]|uniref:hypothetical protein n=1 Tax=unclassified Mesorhizobium TaxID=325217 RepID=UPI001FEF846E|nr:MULTISPECIES: hypothetical protein [unclassified Mesorhizobium]
MASVLKRLVFVTVAAAAAAATQFVMHNNSPLPENNLQYLIKPNPEVIAGVASVIDGDTTEVHGQRIRRTASTRPRASSTAMTPRASMSRHPSTDPTSDMYLYEVEFFAKVGPAPSCQSNWHVGF